MSDESEYEVEAERAADRVEESRADVSDGRVVDSLTLRFVGKNEDGSELHELRAAQVAEVLQGLVELTSDFEKAGVFNPEGLDRSEVLVRPPVRGSFEIDIVRFVTDNWDTMVAAGAGAGVPSLAKIVFWATKAARADVKNYERQGNGMVKIVWQDDVVSEVPAAVWDELQVRKRRRRKHLRQLMAPLADTRVTALDVSKDPEDKPTEVEGGETPEAFKLTRPDYNAVRPEDDIEESNEIFEAEAQMAAVDFDDHTKWRVKTTRGTRKANVEDPTFLARVANGLAIRSTDIFRLRIREDTLVKNGRTTRAWTVLRVESYRRAAGDNTET